MAVTRYFAEQVVRKRPYLTEQICRLVIEKPLQKIQQPDARFRFWGAATLPGEQKPRILRVVTLEDGETIHNAFIDRDFRED